MAIATGLAGLTGILGTLTFTVLRRKRGLEFTGVLAYLIEVACLSLCVASLFTPGTLFAPVAPQHNAPSHCSNNTIQPSANPNRVRRELHADVTPHLTFTAPPLAHNGLLPLYFCDAQQNCSFGSPHFRQRRDVVVNVTSNSAEYAVSGGVVTPVECEEPKRSYTSVLLFLVGIITSRVGEDRVYE